MVTDQCWEKIKGHLKTSSSGSGLTLAGRPTGGARTGTGNLFLVNMHRPVLQLPHTYPKAGLWWRRGEEQEPPHLAGSQALGED